MLWPDTQEHSWGVPPPPAVGAQRAATRADKGGIQQLCVGARRQHAGRVGAAAGGMHMQSGCAAQRQEAALPRWSSRRMRSEESREARGAQHTGADARIVSRTTAPLRCLRSLGAWARPTSAGEGRQASAQGRGLVLRNGLVSRGILNLDEQPPSQPSTQQLGPLPLTRLVRCVALVLVLLLLLLALVRGLRGRCGAAVRLLAAPGGPQVRRAEGHAAAVGRRVAV